MKCKSCGTNLAKGQKFCRNCGKKVQRVSSSAIAIIIAIVLWSLVGIVYIDDCNKEWEEQERQEKIEQQKFAEECPIEVVAKVKDNIIDYPELRCNIKNKTGKDIIAYEYIPGPFIRVLVRALNNPNEQFLLLIEEINRASVAAVFGDVFQLLDRAPDGSSIYPIMPSFYMALCLIVCLYQEKEAGWMQRTESILSILYRR